MNSKIQLLILFVLNNSFHWENSRPFSRGLPGRVLSRSSGRDFQEIKYLFAFCSATRRQPVRRPSHNPIEPLWCFCFRVVSLLSLSWHAITSYTWQKADGGSRQPRDAGAGNTCPVENEIHSVLKRRHFWFVTRGSNTKQGTCEHGLWQQTDN